MADYSPVALDLRGQDCLVVGTGPAAIKISVADSSSPALAQRLQQRIEAAIGPEYGTLAGLLDQVACEAREASLYIPPAAWQVACDDHLLDLLRTDHVAEALHLLRTRLVGAALQEMRATARLHLDDEEVATPKGDLVFAA